MAETDSIYYAVVNRETEAVVYCIGQPAGSKVRIAMLTAWTKGTDHGQGPTEAKAIADARQNAIRVRQGLEAAARRLDRERR